MDIDIPELCHCVLYKYLYLIKLDNILNGASPLFKERCEQYMFITSVLTDDIQDTLDELPLAL
jgi:hypothetical protein